VLAYFDREWQVWSDAMGRFESVRCHSAWGPDADRNAKLLIILLLTRSHLGADPQFGRLILDIDRRELHAGSGSNSASSNPATVLIVQTFLMFISTVAACFGLLRKVFKTFIEQ
jgi:hypothetical protein